MPGKIYLVYGLPTRITAIKRQPFGKDTITSQIEDNRGKREEFRGSIFTFRRPSVKKAEAIIAEREQRESVETVIRREMEGKKGKYIEIPQEVRAVERVYDISEEMVQMLEDEYGALGQSNRLHLVNGMGELIRNAKRHGNNGDPGKKVFVCHYQIEKGFVIEVIDEGEGSLFLISLPDWLRHEASLFRPGYHGMNIGLYSIQLRFGKKNLTAHKLFDKDGNRVGTRIRLTVAD